MDCSGCGQQLAPESKFCNGCGGRVADTTLRGATSTGPSCPRCNSPHVHAEKRGWTLTTGMMWKNKIYMTCLNCNFRFKPGQRALAHHPTVEMPTGYWTKWLIIYFGGAAIVMAIFSAILLVGEKAPAQNATPTSVIARASDGMEGAQAIISDLKERDSLAATVDHAGSSDKSYVGRIHGSLSNGHFYAASVACARDTANCSPLRVGERIVFASLPKDDLDEYLVGATVLDGQKITVKASIRLKGSGNSAVYFMYE